MLQTLDMVSTVDEQSNSNHCLHVCKYLSRIQKIAPQSHFSWSNISSDYAASLWWLFRVRKQQSDEGVNWKSWEKFLCSLRSSGQILQQRDHRKPEHGADERGVRIRRVHCVHEARPGLQGRNARQIWTNQRGVSGKQPNTLLAAMGTEAIKIVE